LEATSLLTIVLAKMEPVLLARNLNNYIQRKLMMTYSICRELAYSEQQVVIKISALCVLLVLILDSSSLNQVNCL
jgi:hypothetical protein